MANDAPLLLDVTRLIWRRWVDRHPTGIDRVCLAYLNHFRDRSQAVIQHAHYRKILDKAASDDLFESLLAPRTEARRGIIKSMLGSATFRSHAGKDRIYLNIGHTGLDRPGFADWVTNAGVKPLYLVHDLIPITHPEYCRPGEAERHTARMRTALKTALGVIGNSQATLDALAEFSRESELSCPPSVAAWLGISERLTAPEGGRFPDHPFFVVVGTIEARKNHLMLLQLWQGMVRRFGAETPKLVIVGQRGWKCEEVFDLLDRGGALNGTVVELGDCSDQLLADHLAGARALLFPSLVEGYGLPLIEALNAGTPVIASDLPVFQEIGRGIPRFLDPLDAAGWEKTILSYAKEDDGPREDQLKRLASYRAPTWKAHFSKVEAWMGGL